MKRIGSLSKRAKANIKNVTTEETVAAYDATHTVFAGIIKEVRELSKKKPDATLNKGKVKLINRVLVDLKGFLKNEPEYKFLDLLDDDDLPQTSDAVLVIVQYESALVAFRKRYYRGVKNSSSYDTRYVWVTDQLTLDDDEVLEE